MLYNKVMVFMSTYNGHKNIIRQIDSIMKQKSVDVTILVRDDGSDAKTKDVLSSLQSKYKDKIILKLESNVGWIWSFQKLLHYPEAQGYDYYAFSDQDDIWKQEKLIACIRLMESDSNYCGPKLAHCNSVTTDSHLNVLEEQEIHYAVPRTQKMAIAQEYFRGCAMIWNQKLMNLIRQYMVKEPIPHDYWVGLLGYYFGKVYYVNAPLFYHIRYESSASADGNLKLARIKRLKSFFKSEHVYINPSRDLLKGYSELLPEDMIPFLKNLAYCNSQLKAKIAIIKDDEFRRESRLATILLKLSVLLGKY